MAKDYYAVLGLSRGASPDDVKQAYRQLSKELHPDKHKGDSQAEKRFKEVNEAYEVLGNPEKKSMYDQYGTTGGQGTHAGGFSGFDFGGAQGFNVGGDFADLFENFFGGGRGQAKSSVGADREMQMTVALADVLKAQERTINVRRQSVCAQCEGSGAAQGTKLASCRDCGGTGQVVRKTRSFFGMIEQNVVCPVCKGRGKVPDRPCTSCRGEGRTLRAEEIRVHIPAGIADGQTLRVRGSGDAGSHGAPPGDLFVHIHVQEDPRFVRDGADTRSTFILRALDAILGTEADIETLHGVVRVRVPEGTQPGHVLRMRGKGLPVLEGRHMGDHFVEVQIEIPKKLSKQERKILEEWKKIRD